ncbi:MAG: hypothetical protein JW864_00535 [Spirochaetes bacterium]|nr:hypothetical protein [Spirochaetota bacterium]
MAYWPRLFSLGAEGALGMLFTIAGSMMIVMFAIGGMRALIVFIHCIMSSIQASSIIASVADETM